MFSVNYHLHLLHLMGLEANTFSLSIAFADLTENYVKSRKNFLSTSVDFIFPHLETSVRRTTSRNNMKLFLLSGFQKGINYDRFFQ